MKPFSLAEGRKIKKQEEYFARHAELRDHLNWQKEDYERRLRQHRLFESKREIHKQMTEKESIEKQLREAQLRDEQELVRRDIQHHRTLERETRAKKKSMQ